MIQKKTLETDTVGQPETIQVSKQAVIDAVVDWERKHAVEHLLLERSLRRLEESARECQNILAGCGTSQAKGALLSLFLSDVEWDRHLRQGLLGDEAESY